MIIGFSQDAIFVTSGIVNFIMTRTEILKMDISHSAGFYAMQIRCDAICLLLHSFIICDKWEYPCIRVRVGIAGILYKQCIYMLCWTIQAHN